MKKPPNLGDLEMDVLRYVTDHAPVTVRDVAKGWGEPNGKARTTILTVMERLREKKFLTRQRGADDSTYQYSPAVAKPDLMRNLVQEFVEKTLGGSVTPFVAYLAESPNLSEQEMNELKRLVDAMEQPTGEREEPKE
jgi:predicted transcriptional regulator